MIKKSTSLKQATPLKNKLSCKKMIRKQSTTNIKYDISVNRQRQEFGQDRRRHRRSTVRATDFELFTKKFERSSQSKTKLSVHLPMRESNCTRESRGEYQKNRELLRTYKKEIKQLRTKQMMIEYEKLLMFHKIKKLVERLEQMS